MTEPVYKQAGLSDAEFDKICELLSRKPNDLETRLIGVMWSEHCSYKSTKKFLSTFPNRGKHVVQSEGENAGVVDCGGGWGLAFKVESHNHPSAVAPYQGAATGVGGIIRDILAMGARPVASMDGLFLGPPSHKKSAALAEGIVEGIAGYGNAVGVPTIGGKTFYDEGYEGNPLVNAFNAGLVRLDSIVSSKTATPGDLAVLLGSKTGRDGIAGASFASRELDEDARESRPQIQIGDPFEEKLLIECCLELRDRGLIRSMQDMGAAGILSSSSEIAHKSGTGMLVDVAKIPLRERMEPWEIFLSESQERMLLVVDPPLLGQVREAAVKWGLECEPVGEILPGGRYRVVDGETELADLPVSILAAAPEAQWDMREPSWQAERRPVEQGLVSGDIASDILELVGSIHGRERREIWEQYDCQVQLNTAEEPGYPVSAIKMPDSDSLILFSMEAEPWKCSTDPYMGAAEATAMSIRVLAAAGAEPLGLTDCLNFPSPEVPEHYWTLAESVRAIGQVCSLADVPVVSGNVSLYNETARGAICPTPLVVTAGLVSHVGYYVPSGRASAEDLIYLVGPRVGSLGSSRWQVLCGSDGHVPQGATVEFSSHHEREFTTRARATSRKSAVDSVRVAAGGGVAVAAALEMMSAGVSIELMIGCGDETADSETISRELLTQILFSEGGPRALYFVKKNAEEKFLAIWEGYPCEKIGRVVQTDEPKLHIKTSTDSVCVSSADLLPRFRAGGLLGDA